MAAAHDHMAGVSTDWTSPPVHAAAVVPSDSADLSDVANRLYVGGAGDVKVITRGGETVTFKAVPVGTFLPIRVKRVLSSGTTATLILALW